MSWRPGRAVSNVTPMATQATSGSQLSIKCRRYALEGIAHTKTNIFRTSLRKSVENFIYDQKRNVVLVQGPRRAPEMSYVCSFGSTGIILSVGDSIETCGEQMNWLKRKHKGIGQESMEGDQRMANYALLCETNSEIRVFELYHFLSFHFPHWELAYHPDVSPYLCIQRRLTPLPRESQPLSLPRHLASSLPTLSRAVYDVLLREANEDAQALSLLNYAENLNQPLDPLHMYARTGRACIYIIDAKGLILHNNQDEQEAYQAYTFIMTILNWFIAPASNADSPFRQLMKQQHFTS
eukprot:Protomagalhaensia_wolfi_Nauph_80__4850@NODE_507_length_2413_cov_11_655013_g377_i0_p2_GENE_NODE_507_length_2413_cov_11_655013_g377_i0NODE_507_length_2413_cov_11_655013_g377_i0_p2_ORF_typecomplete_len295_score24_54FRG2/PF15315_6/0_32_NODE_507_length_2413_cov_11_655013_g377_i014312315